MKASVWLPVEKDPTQKEFPPEEWDWRCGSPDWVSRGGPQGRLCYKGGRSRELLRLEAKSSRESWKLGLVLRVTQESACFNTSNHSKACSLTQPHPPWPQGSVQGPATLTLCTVPWPKHFLTKIRTNANLSLGFLGIRILEGNVNMIQHMDERITVDIIQYVWKTCVFKTTHILLYYFIKSGDICL